MYACGDVSLRTALLTHAVHSWTQVVEEEGGQTYQLESVRLTYNNHKQWVQ